MMNHSPRIVLDDLALYMDAGNIKSYPGSGSTFYDLTHTADGSITGATYSSGTLVFDGSDYINCGQHLATANNSSITLCAFAKTSSTSGYQTVLGTNASYSQVGFWTTYIYMGRDGGGGNNLISVQSCSTNTWYFLTMTYDGFYAQFYVNGSNILSNQDIGTNNTANGVTMIGSYNTAGSEPLTGSIGLVMAYNRVLNSSEVLQNYNTLKKRFGL
jgi:hypothetical protein